MKISRIMIAGTKSGCGKTSVSCGLLRLLQRQGKSPAAFKCGPDYIDPIYHREVLDVASRNLDSFFCTKEELVRELIKGSAHADISVIEGVMGYYDGLGITGKTSPSEIAALTDTPVLLIVDGAGRGASVLAELSGFCSYRPEGRRIKGVLFNRMAPSVYADIKDEVKKMGLLPLGCLPKDEALRFERRHLGLVLPVDGGRAEEKERFLAQVDAVADALLRYADIEGICSLAGEASEIDVQDQTEDPIIKDREENRPKKEGRKNVRIAIAEDEAFCFIYEANKEALRREGCTLISFSPLKDKTLPVCDGVILPGGYPELHAKQLSENTGMLFSIREAAREGLPMIAECGGFLYLHRDLTDPDGNTFPLANVLDASCRYAGFQRQFGYVNMETKTDSVLGRKGSVCKGHEFHYYLSDRVQEDATCKKPTGKAWNGCVLTKTMYAGFVHLWLSGNGEMLRAFISACAEYAEKRDV
ncbi:MAG: cobyrinate a,c-diamide synthase [Lachnospiraceae bacterium]|nr:cobyrinate a,c-diamide synthase [Lachnospiraceae bacterium]